VFFSRFGGNGAHWTLGGKGSEGLRGKEHEGVWRQGRKRGQTRLLWSLLKRMLALLKSPWQTCRGRRGAKQGGTSSEEERAQRT
jgi:hypothetical protein